ncbi:DNA topoisomerase IV [Pseudofulvibacter geojedonensis]|uniref:DNA topoisomerase IV n=1 Tax=Pseudofulvibacter geojedonensis TaxID=1123758 RepID=A0ABW3HZ23_9FLAO
MQKISLFILLILITSCYEKPERNCSDFKSGTFEYEYEVKGELKKATFTRNDTLEIDYHGKHIDSIHVTWINDCEYILRNINPKTMLEKKAIHFKILTTKGNTYTFESQLVNDPLKRKSKGTVTKTN